ncbi:MAG: ferritin-like domain-containing protein [Chloroflexi bacterium]|nr:ferritin-like domain-containing protein [Chloroflexota bacterium]
MKLKSLHDLLVDEMKDIYDAEQQLTKALPKMVKAASAPVLKKAFEDHLAVTEGHVNRLEKAFQKLETKATRKTCEAMKGLIEEGQSVIEEEAEPSVKDAALIAAAQKVEHYEIATYGTLRTFANQLGYSEVATLFQATLDEEADADEILTQCAQHINAEAAK